jgi:hypothetical protein
MWLSGISFFCVIFLFILTFYSHSNFISSIEVHRADLTATEPCSYQASLGVRSAGQDSVWEIRRPFQQLVRLVAATKEGSKSIVTCFTSFEPKRVKTFADPRPRTDALSIRVTTSFTFNVISQSNNNRHLT